MPNGQRALDVNWKIRVQERDFVQAVALYEFGYLADYALRPVCVKSPFVEDLIRAVVASVGAANTCGVAHLPLAANPRVNVKVCQMVSRRGQVVNVFDRPLGFVDNPPILLMRGPTNACKPVTLGQTFCDLKQRQLTLPSNNGVNKARLHGLCRQEAGVPPAEDDWQAGVGLLDLTRDPDPGLDHRAGQKRDAQADRVLGFPGNDSVEVRSNRSVHHRNGKT